MSEINGSEKMFKFSSSSREEVESDTDSTLTDLTLTPGDIHSPGTASTFSLQWTEDAVRKNKEEWERIEKMMYGEEPLPVDDESLRMELTQWMTAFPHLRVVGVPCEIHYNPALKPSDADYEEIFAIHPGGKKTPEPQNIPIRTLDFEFGNMSIARHGYIEKVKTIEIDPNGKVTRNSVVYRKIEPQRLPDVGFLMRRSGTSTNASRSATMRTSLPPITGATSFDGIVGRSISATIHSRKHVKRKSQLPSLSGEDS